MLAYLNTLKERAVDRFTDDTAGLLSQVAQLEAKIEAAIDKDLRKGEKLVQSAQALNNAILSNDKNLNAAYKLLNGITGLTR
jgi:glutaredoxin 2